MMSSSELFKQIARHAQGRAGSTRPFRLLRDALNRHGLAPEEIDRAGRFIQKARADDPPAKGYAQCSTPGPVHDELAPAGGDGGRLGPRPGLLGRGGGIRQRPSGPQPASGRATAPDVVVFFPWTQRLLAARGRSASGSRMS